MIDVSASTEGDAALQEFNGVVVEKSFTKAHLRSHWYLALRLKGQSLYFRVSGHEIGDKRIKSFAERLVVGDAVNLSCQLRTGFHTL